MKTCVVCGMEKEHPNHDSLSFGKYAHDFKTYKPSFKKALHPVEGEKNPRAAQGKED